MRTRISTLVAVIALALGIVPDLVRNANSGEIDLNDGFTILSLNDVYRIEGLVDSDMGSLARVRTIRKQLESQGDVLVLHAGDFRSALASLPPYRAGPL